MTPPQIFFVDRSLGRAVGLALRELGEEIRLPKEIGIPDDAADVDWIPFVSGNSWVILTKDKHMRHNVSERQALYDAKARVITLSAGSLRGPDMVRAFVGCRAALNRIARDTEAPFVANLIYLREYVRFEMLIEGGERHGRPRHFDSVWLEESSVRNSTSAEGTNSPSTDAM